MNFKSASNKTFNTAQQNHYTFYEEIIETIQEEPLEMLDPETSGLLAYNGIKKGKLIRFTKIEIGVGKIIAK